MTALADEKVSFFDDAILILSPFGGLRPSRSGVTSTLNFPTPAATPPLRLPPRDGEVGRAERVMPDQVGLRRRQRKQCFQLGVGDGATRGMAVLSQLK